MPNPLWSFCNCDFSVFCRTRDQVLPVCFSKKLGWLWSRKRYYVFKLKFLSTIRIWCRNSKWRNLQGFSKRVHHKIGMQRRHLQEGGALSVYGASESELTIAQQFLDRCFKRRYISKKLEIGELLKVQDHRICRKVSSIPNHPLRANFPETKITRYNLRNKSPAMPAIHTDRFKNTFFNRIVFKYNVPL